MNLKPGDFPIGSPESRAAARMFAENRQETRKRIQIVTNVQLPWHGEEPDPENPENWPPGEPHVGPWKDFGDTLIRFVSVSLGMSAEEVRNIEKGVN